VNYKRLLIGLLAAAFFSIPAQAGTVGLYGSYWDTDQADSSWGAGARVGFDFLDWLELEFHGTYYPDLQGDLAGLPETLDISAIPVDGGLKFKFAPKSPVTPYVGAGFTYYFLDINDGEIDNTTGWYAEAGLLFGAENTRFLIEGMWRAMDTSIALNAFDANANFEGWCLNAGVNWRWGQ
jgi:outer membrane protein W